MSKNLTKNGPMLLFHELRAHCKRAFVIGIIIMASSGFSLLQSCGGDGKDSERPSNALVVKALRANKISEYSVTRTYIGEVEAARRSNVGFEISGMLSMVGFEEGDFVERGDVLAELDTERLHARRTELLAASDQERADLELAEITRKRTKEALELNAVSSQDYDKADKNYKARQAAVRRADSAIRTVEVDIEKSKLRAPYDAIISRRYVDEGEVVQSGQPVLEILERTRPEVRIGVAGGDFEYLTVGNEMDVEVRGRIYGSKVKSILPVRNQNTRTVDLILTLDAEFDGIREGDLAKLKMERPISKEGFWLPIGSLTESSRGLWSCYVAVLQEGDGVVDGATYRLDRRELEVLHQESGRVFVQGTLNEGDLVVDGGIQRLVPGQSVRVEMVDAVVGGLK